MKIPILFGAVPRARRLGLVLLLVPVVPSGAQFSDEPREALPPLPERRTAVLREVDADHDGRLDAREREAARKAWAAKQLSRRNDRGPFRPPPELLEEFDVNKDGELDEEEGRKAMETMGRRFEQMRRDYDKNSDGRLDEDEIAAAVKDIDAGKLKGIPKMFVQFAGGPRGPRGRPGGPGGPGGPGAPGMGGEDDPAEVLRAADRDRDGRLSAEELKIVRAEWAKRRAARPQPNPGPGQNPGSTPRP